MLKNWSKFNENVDNFESVIEGKFSEIRDILIEFEDDGILNNYSILLSGEESKESGLTFNPKVGDFERWFSYCISQIKNRIEFFKVENATICIIANMKLPISNKRIGYRDVQDYYQVMDSNGIKKFSDIITANSRLASSGYEVKFDLAASHPEYKPLKMLIYFTI
jgi:hypothetical protein